MKKKVLVVMMCMALGLASLTGCGGAKDNGKTPIAEQDEASGTLKEQDEAPITDQGEEQNEASEASREEEQDEAPAANTDEVTVRVGSLKGPTSMGLVSLMSRSEKGEAEGNYEFTMATTADELLPQMTSGSMDIALVPANVASVLYNKTEGGISVIDINTLGVLYMVSGDDSIQAMSDLAGKTVYLTGKGTSPDYVLQYLLAQNSLSLDDVILEYKSEATEVVSYLAQNPEAIGVLPQPFVTAACMQNENLNVVMDLTAEWAALQKESGSSLVTGVTIVRNDFLQEHPEAVATFMKEHKESAAYANENIEEAAELVASYGIIEKAPVAVKAMPYCNITYIDGEEMKAALSGYLEVLYEKDAASVGGNLPADDFYYLP